MHVVELSAKDTISIRHKVLWPNEPPEYCVVDGDDDALHFGVVVDNELVSVASIFVDRNSKVARLRKFATLSEFQGRGIGSFLLRYILNILINQGFSYFWFDARSSAVNFYHHLGFKISGKLFYKNKVSYYKMYINL